MDKKIECKPELSEHCLQITMICLWVSMCRGKIQQLTCAKTDQK